MVVILGYNEKGEVVKSLLLLDTNPYEYLRDRMVEENEDIVRAEIVWPEVPYEEEELHKDALSQMGYITDSLWQAEDFYDTGFPIPVEMLNEEYADELFETAYTAVSQAATGEGTIAAINESIACQSRGLYTDHCLTETVVDSREIVLSDVIDNEFILIGDVVEGEIKNISLLRIYYDSDEEDRPYIAVNNTICYLDNVADMEERLEAKVDRELSEKLSSYIPDSHSRTSVEDFVEDVKK